MRPNEAVITTTRAVRPSLPISVAGAAAIALTLGTRELGVAPPGPRCVIGSGLKGDAVSPFCALNGVAV